MAISPLNTAIPIDGEKVGLAQWCLDYKAEATGLDFPFDRPYLDLYARCVKALRAANAFLRNPPQDKKVTRALKRLRRHLEPVANQFPFRQIPKRLRRRAALFDELRDVLRMTTTPAQDETELDLDQMRKQLDKLVVSFRQRRVASGLPQNTSEAIDIILKHLKTHGDNLWGHAIRLPDHAGAVVRLVSRTNFTAENFFGELKHGERRRSGRKNLAQDLENLPAEATLVRNLEHDDYVSIVCGSLDRLPEVFAKLDHDQHERKLKGMPHEAKEEHSLSAILNIASASLSSADRRIVRSEGMNHRVAAAAKIRAPRPHC